VLSNSSPVGAPEAICRSFIELVMTGKVARDWLALFGNAFAKMDEPTYGRDADYAKPPLAAAPPAALSAYVGIYESDLYGPITITQDVKGLSLQLGPARTSYAMHNFSGDVFTFQPPGENAFGPSPIRFARNGSEKASTVRIDYFDGNGQGVFTRAAA
jgi:hypothetical protein